MRKELTQGLMNSRGLSRIASHGIAVGTIALFAGGLVACDGDDDGMGPDTERATVGAAMTDAPSGGGSEAAGGASSYQGSFTGSVTAEIYAEAEGWISLGGPADVNLTLQSSDETQVAAAVSVPASTYSRVRFTLSGARAAIQAGASLGGLLLTADVSIMVGGSDNMVVIEKTVPPFELEANASTTVVFDLNSEVWVNSNNAQSETTTDAEVEAATAVFLRAS